MGLCAYADQVIYIDMADPDALDGYAFGSPGDNDRNGANPLGAPFLVYKFPVKVEDGESTADGKKWIPWARMRVPAEQTRSTDRSATTDLTGSPKPMAIPTVGMTIM